MTTTKKGNSLTTCLTILALGVSLLACLGFGAAYALISPDDPIRLISSGTEVAGPASVLVLQSPTPFYPPTWTPTNTSTPAPTGTPTITGTPTATDTPTYTPSPLATKTPTITLTPTPTETGTPTNTPIPTNTPVPIPYVLNLTQRMRNCYDVGTDGFVQDTNGLTGVSGVTVKVGGSSISEMTASTDSNGYYGFRLGSSGNVNATFWTQLYQNGQPASAKVEFNLFGVCDDSGSVQAVRLYWRKTQ
jgi:hypothetical protein